VDKELKISARRHVVVLYVKDFAAFGNAKRHQRTILIHGQALQKCSPVDDSGGCRSVSGMSSTCFDLIDSQLNGEVLFSAFIQRKTVKK